MVIFTRLKIKIYKFFEKLFWIYLSCKPDSKPVWLSRWWYNLTLKVGQYFYRKVGETKRRNSLAVRFSFAKFGLISNIKQYKFNSYEQFFRFYMKNHEKGIIFDVKETREYKHDTLNKFDYREFPVSLYGTFNETQRG